MLANRDRYPGRVRWFHDSPCEGVIDAFYLDLRRLGYINNRVRILVRAAQHFAHFASRRNALTADFDENLLQFFMVHLKRCRCSRYSGRQRISQQKGARLFLQHLRDTAVISRPMAAPENKQPALLTEFYRWMRQERGTADSALRDYGIEIQALFSALGEDPGKFDAKGLRDFVTRRSQHRGQRLVQRCITALRMFLCFLVAENRCAAGLVGSIPTLVHWRLTSLPRYLQSEDVEGIIGSCDPLTARGKRDRAILLLLARLGLRAGDIVQLRLTDVNWKEAWIRVTGKSRREMKFPLTQEIGAALAVYLRSGRPRTDGDHLFVRCVAPFRPFSSHCAVSTLVANAMRRAGVTRPSRGAAHLLRHSLATSLLREGASLQDIAVVLRHKSVETTQIYAKVDVAALKEIAQPWPRVSPC
jgi:integrase/recombinase XerD